MSLYVYQPAFLVIKPILIELYRRDNAWTEEVFRGREAVITLDSPPVTLALETIYADVWNTMLLDQLQELAAQGTGSRDDWEKL